MRDAIKLDRIDVRILSKLQTDGRISKVKLAEHVNLSTSACFERIERLVEGRLIKRYSAEIDLKRIVKIETMYVQITLQSHRLEDFQVFERAVAATPEIVECVAVQGGIDYILKVVTTDLTHYQEVLEQLLGARVGIDRCLGYVAVKTVKSGSGAPLEHLLNRHARDA